MEFYSNATAATAAKAGHIVVVSVITAALAKKSIFGDQFKPVEESARNCGIPFTLVRLPMFMDNNLGQPIKDGAIYMPIGAEKNMSTICTSRMPKYGAESAWVYHSTLYPSI